MTTVATSPADLAPAFTDALDSVWSEVFERPRRYQPEVSAAAVVAAVAVHTFEAGRGTFGQIANLHAARAACGVLSIDVTCAEATEDWEVLAVMAALAYVGALPDCTPMAAGMITCPVCHDDAFAWSTTGCQHRVCRNCDHGLCGGPCTG